MNALWILYRGNKKPIRTSVSHTKPQFPEDHFWRCRHSVEGEHQRDGNGKQIGNAKRLYFRFDWIHETLNTRFPWDLTCFLFDCFKFIVFLLEGRLFDFLLFLFDKRCNSFHLMGALSPPSRPNTERLDPAWTSRENAWILSASGCQTRHWETHEGWRGGHGGWLLYAID